MPAKRKQRVTKDKPIPGVLDYGREFLTDETVSQELLQKSDLQLLSLLQATLTDRIYLISPRELLGFIGACCHVLITRESPLLTLHPGIPWREFCFLHRVLDSSIRPVKMLPLYTFTEGIYYDPELNRQARIIIESIDLPDLKTAIDKIINNNLYQQRAPIACYTRKIYNFYYNECHLNFIRHACESIVDIYRHYELLNSKDTDSLDEFWRRSLYLYFVSIGEAFVRLSDDVLQGFNPLHIKSFKQARNVLSHPERRTYEKDLNKLCDEILKIDSPGFIRIIIEIRAIALRVLISDYRYKFNAEINSLDYFPKSNSETQERVNPATQSAQLHRVICAHENYGIMQQSSSQVSLAFLTKPPLEILNISAMKDNFVRKIVTTIRSDKTPDYYDCMSYLEEYYNLYQDISAKSEDTRTLQERGILIDYAWINKALLKKLISSDRDINAIKYRLYYLQVFEVIARTNGRSDAELNSAISDVHNKLALNFFHVQATSEDGYNALMELARFYDGINPDKSKFNLTKCIANFENKISRLRPTTTANTILKPNIDAGSAAHQIEKITSLHQEYLHLTQIYESIETKAEDPDVRKLIDRFRVLFFGSMAWYYNIVMGSITRRLLENNSLAQPRYNKFKDLLKSKFKAPRSDLAHNQIAVIGDEEFISLCKKYHEGLARGELLIQGPHSRCVDGIQSDDDGQYYISSIPWKHFPAASIGKEGLLNEKEVYPVYLALKFMSKQQKAIYLFYHIARDECAKIKVTMFFSDNRHVTLEAAQANHFLTTVFQSDMLDQYKKRSVSLTSLKRRPEDIHRLIGRSLSEFTKLGLSPNINKCILFMSDELHGRTRTASLPRASSDSEPASSRKRSCSL